MKRYAGLIAVLLFFISPLLLSAKIILPSFFGDNMVLQQKTEAAIGVAVLNRMLAAGRPNSVKSLKVAP